MSTQIEKDLHSWFTNNKKTLAFAESCTGGRLSSQITAMPGSSVYFLGSLVVYSNKLKEKILYVSPETLSTKGAVSLQAAEEMLSGLFLATGADFGVAVTGLAGPSGGSLEKPVGTVFYALGKKEGKPESGSFCAQGNREEVMLSTSHLMLKKLLQLCQNTNS